MLARLRALALALAGAALALLALAAPAAAHDEIQSTSPKAGATLTTAPTSVVLTFGEDVVAVGTKVAVTTASGAVVSDGEATISGGTVTQPLQPLTENGTYTVAYRVVSADGHPVSDTFTFTLQSAAASTSSAAATSSDPSTATSAAGTATSAATATPAATTGAGTTVGADSTTASAPGADAGGSGAVWVAVLVAAVLAIGVAAWLLARRGPAGVDADDPRDGTGRG